MLGVLIIRILLIGYYIRVSYFREPPNRILELLSPEAFPHVKPEAPNQLIAPEKDGGNQAFV